ncbi:MAG: hypothetical protein E7Z75_06720 [Methanobrevibacter olleyae]|uniref:Uncharacterized protein n=1 Tax=Methanobrevibacter olleyae TaxID=294671 RepID=A0A8T3VQ12_METOL|nr:hypothetical protein [Methanobrevibacter olleyae]
MKRSSKVKLAFAFALLMIFIVAVNPASSALFDFLEEPATNVTVCGVDFVIPSGYEYDENFTDLMELMAEDDFKAHNGEVKCYESDDGNITIMVSEDRKGKISNLYSAGYDAKTINGHKGAIKYMSDMDNYMYVFMEDDKLAVVYVDDKDLLEEIIV